MKFKDAVFNVCQTLECVFLICAVIVMAPLCAVGAVLFSPVILYDWYDRERDKREHEARCKEIWGDRVTASVSDDDSVCHDEASYMS